MCGGGLLGGTYHVRGRDGRFVAEGSKSTSYSRVRSCQGLSLDDALGRVFVRMLLVEDVICTVDGRHRLESREWRKVRV